MTAFFTSDWHLGDPRVEIMGRPFDDENHMAKAIADAYDAKITDEDTVYINGDVVANPSWEGWEQFLKDRPGKKILFRGNHDRKLTDEELNPYFDLILPEGEGMGLTISNGEEDLDIWVVHYPTLSRADRFNLVGHIHSSWRVQKNMLNVGIDANLLQPVSEDKVIFAYNAIKGFYDHDVWVANHPANKAHNKRGMDHRYFVPDSEKMKANFLKRLINRGNL